MIFWNSRWIPFQAFLHLYSKWLLRKKKQKIPQILRIHISCISLSDNLLWRPRFEINFSSIWPQFKRPISIYVYWTCKQPNVKILNSCIEFPVFDKSTFNIACLIDKFRLQLKGNKYIKCPLNRWPIIFKNLLHWPSSGKGYKDTSKTERQLMRFKSILKFDQLREIFETFIELMFLWSLSAVVYHKVTVTDWRRNYWNKFKRPSVKNITELRLPLEIEAKSDKN